MRQAESGLLDVPQVWLLKQVLPAIQAEDPGLVAVRADDSVGVRVVSAWVRWFLGDQPDHASWEMAAPSAGQVPVPLWPQVFFLLRTGHYQDAVALATRHSHHPTIKKALAAWVESGGMHRVGLIDTDGDGSISPDEMIETFQRIGQNWDMTEIHQFLHNIDEDKWHPISTRHAAVMAKWCPRRCRL